ncbi:MAG TPA: peptide-methionine (R)-S-oxide reductase MsrB [Bryobacteraceae bacterium]|nr:peptide-methionine (R)-S-oxide reductase MsrB [Bryobacteraceae bacterium]
MKAVFEQVKEELTRRRALLITPFAFAGLIAVAARKGRDSEPDVPADDSNQEVTIIQFSDAGENLGPARVPKVVHSSSEWRKLLNAEQYYVLRQAGTDTAFTGTYYQMHQRGVYRCAGCRNALFGSQTKFDSDTGWPSFWAPLAEANLYTRKDTSLSVERVEVLCRRCDSHLGHVFHDGPEPTYLRYCLNESALAFCAGAA